MTHQIYSGIYLVQCNKTENLEPNSVLKQNLYFPPTTKQLRRTKESLMDCVQHDPETHMGIQQKKLLEVKKSQPHKRITTVVPTLTSRQLQATLCCVPTLTATHEVSGDHESTSLFYQSSHTDEQSLLNKKWA